MPLLQEMKQLNILCWENVDGCAQTTTRDKIRRGYYNKFVLRTTAKYTAFSYNQFFRCAMTCAFAHDVHMHLQLGCFKLYLAAFLTILCELLWFPFWKIHLYCFPLAVFPCVVSTTLYHTVTGHSYM